MNIFMVQISLPSTIDILKNIFLMKIFISNNIMVLEIVDLEKGL